MDFDGVVVELKRIYESDPVLFGKIVGYIRRAQGVVKIQKATKKNENFVRFSISKQRYGAGRVKYVALGKILKELYSENREEVDLLCNAGDVEGLLSKSYFVLKEEESVIQNKIADFYKK